jgi:hypothetical protein
MVVGSIFLLALASGCGGHSTSTGMVTGIFEIVGGPATNRVNRLEGTVDLTSSVGKQTTLEARKDGSISAQLAPGIYTATGHSPRVHSGSRETTCFGLAQVVVRAGKSTHVIVACQVP